MNAPEKDKPTSETPAPESGEAPSGGGKADKPVPEIGGRKGPDPTRFGDWEKDGRCIDF
jgi:hypothetical protein